MSKRQIFISLFLMGLLYSCSPESKFKEQLEAIEKYHEKIDSVDQLFLKIDFDSLSSIVETVKKNEALVKKVYNADTLNKEFAIAINEYKGIRKGMKRPSGDRLKIETEIKELKEQLVLLKTDIEKGLLSEEEVQKFTEREFNDCDHFINEFEIFHSTYIKVNEIFEKYHYIVEHEIQKYLTQ